jgi:NAD-dependent deacetylase
LTQVQKIKKAAALIRDSNFGVAFTGAGISVDSGIPTFRGEDGLWNSVNPIYLEIEFFNKKPLQSWKVIKEIFYDKFGDAKPNISHRVLSKMEERGLIQAVVTQNIDHLHTIAGNKEVYELHGTYKTLICTKCTTEYESSFADLNFLPPTCFVCKGMLKPEIVFFNEKIPELVKTKSFELAEKCDLMLIIGTNADVYPANAFPVLAHKHNATIIEINIIESQFTHSVTDIFLKGTASEVMEKLGKLLNLID